MVDEVTTKKEQTKPVKKAAAKGVNLVMAEDVLISDDFSADANTKVVCANEIPDGWEGVDAGEKTIAKFAKVILESKTILWNGPVGAFEID